jgi:hypothetical protein
MKKGIGSVLNGFLRKFGLTLSSNEPLWERDALFALQEARVQWKPKALPVQGIIFSRDRALQLHAGLTSFIEKVKPPAPLFILHLATSERHQRAYDDLMKIFMDQPFTFIPQQSGQSFRADLLSILSCLDADRVFFLTDDILFIESVDLENMADLDTDRFVPSLRMGENLTWSYTLQKNQPLPPWHPDQCPDPDKRVWKWNEGILDWGYPLSVDGHFFSTWEMTAMVKLIRFHSPNTLEDELQKFRPMFMPRYGISFAKSHIVNIPWNRVQTDRDNLSEGIDPEHLLEQWEKGRQIDFRKLYGVTPTSVHQVFPLEFTERK